MNAASVKGRSFFATLIIVVAAVLSAGAVPAMAQTPDAACAADSLYLISPESLDLRLETTGKPGLTVRWPSLDPELATCFSLDQTDDLGFEVTVGGGFNDRVDRLFRFSTPDSGTIGGQNDGNISVTWRNQGPATNGSVGGAFNLANNGGVWLYGQASGTWNQANNGLPMTWQQVNTVALDRGTGDFMVAAFTGGLLVESASTGLYTYNGTNWNRVAADIFDESILVTAIAISATDNNSFAVGTLDHGLFVTNDGGATFTQWGSELENPATRELPATYRVSALNWESARLIVFMPNWGLFISANDGASFVRSPIEVPEDLNQTEPRDLTLPIVNDIAVDPTDADHLVIAMLFHGAYESTDGGATWQDLYGDLIVVDPEGIDDLAWQHSGMEVLFDAADPRIIVLAVSQKGLYRSADGGSTWSLVAADLQPSNLASLAEFSLVRLAQPGQMLALENEWLLLHSTDSGATWAPFAVQPKLNTGLVLVAHRDGSGDFTFASTAGGIYVPGSTIPLTDTYTTITSPELRAELDLGLTVTFDGGVVQPDDEFRLVAQTFQGWAVWRGPSHDPQNVTLIGLYDRVNPEDCFEGYCGDNSLEIVPQCFAAKRAACFNLSEPDTIRFFDEEVYNGFSYVYSVTSFDYGNTALTTAENNTNRMLFSPRWTNDTASPFAGFGNQTRIDVNEPAAAALRDEEIYAFPNPVRLGTGVPGGEGSRVVFTNLPEGSRVRVFTTAGDDVVNLGPDIQTGGQIYWSTINHEGEDIAAGIYLYKVEMPQREDYWGRLVVIR